MAKKDAAAVLHFIFHRWRLRASLRAAAAAAAAAAFLLLRGLVLPRTDRGSIRRRRRLTWGVVVVSQS